MFKLFTLLLIPLAGCASMGYSGMTADQITAATKDKNFSAICQTISGVWGSEKFVYANVDRGSVPNGSIVVNPDCTIGMNNAQIVRPGTTSTTITVPVPLTITH